MSLNPLDDGLVRLLYCTCDSMQSSWLRTSKTTTFLMLSLIIPCLVLGTVNQGETIFHVSLPPSPKNRESWFHHDASRAPNIWVSWLIYFHVPYRFGCCFLSKNQLRFFPTSLHNLIPRTQITSLNHTLIPLSAFLVLRTTNIIIS